MATFSFYESAFEVKYLKYIGATKTPYYQRRVPTSLVDRFGAKMLKIRIDPNKGSIVTQINDLAKWHDSLFKGLVEHPETRLPTEREAAIKLLYEYGLKEGQGIKPLTPSQNGGPQFSDTPHLDDFFHYYSQKKSEGRLTDVDELALQALKSPLPKMVSELFDIYISVKPRAPEWIVRNKRVWNRFLQIVGDMPVALIDRDAARKYRDARELETVKRRVGSKLIDREIRSGTIEREINLLRAVFSEALPELKANIPNPFTRMRSTKQGKDADKREPLNRQELEHLIKYCYKQDDDLAAILLIQAFSGCRLGEIVGLRVSDVKLTHEIPHFNIEAYGERTVKTEHSIRSVPLHPVVMPLITAQLKRAGKSRALFSGYNNLKSKPKADSAGAAINKRLRTLFGEDKHFTTHCFRHTLIDAFDNANISKDRRDQFMGHSRQDAASNYGKGRSLEQKYKDLALAMKYKKPAK